VTKHSILAGAFFLALALCGPAVRAEQLTTVAIIDTGRVYTTYFRESQTVRDWERLKLSVQDELNKYFAETTRLQSERLDAAKQGNNAEVLRLEQEIAKRQQFYADYKRVKQQQIADAGKSLMQGDSFLTEIMAAIKYVAESEGYTVVLDSGDTYLRFWSPEVDITDKVLDYLKKLGKN
jgi:outer membrane protein